MKKIIIIIAVIIVLALAAGAFFLLKPGEGQGDGGENQGVGTDGGSVDGGLPNDFVEYYEAKTITDVKTVEEFIAVAEEKGYHYEMLSDKSIASLYNLPLYDNTSTVATFYFDKKGNTQEIAMYYYANGIASLEEGEITTGEITAEDLGMKVENNVQLFCSMFNCRFEVDLYLTCLDGTFKKVESGEDYQLILDGKAYLDFALRDENGYYWHMRTTYESGLIMVNIRKQFDVEKYRDYMANISLYEKEHTK